MGRESGKRGAAARCVKKLENYLKPARFLFFSFFSLFYIYLFFLLSFQINNLHSPRPLEPIKIRKETRNKS